MEFTVAAARAPGAAAAQPRDAGKPDGGGEERFGPNHQSKQRRGRNKIRPHSSEQDRRHGRPELASLEEVNQMN
jgi:hypothetical protein